MVENMGANHGPHRGAQAVVHVHQFQGWPQVGPKNPTENWYPTHRNVTKFDRCVYVHLLHFIPKKSLEICIFGSLGFPSFYLQQTSGTFTCNLDESPDIPPISELIQLGPTGRCSSYLPTHKQFLI